MLAAVPILLILVLMIGLRTSAARADGIGLAVAIVLAWSSYGLGSSVLPELGIGAAVGGAMTEAAFIAATILWIIFPALCIHELQTRTGGMDVLQEAMARITGDPRIMALLVAWFFVLFVEGAAGFGTSVALAAPFLVSAGFGRVTAVSRIDRTCGRGIVRGRRNADPPQVTASGQDALSLAGATASYHVLLGWLMPLAIMLLAARALPGGVRGAPLWGWSLFAAVCFLLPYFLLARYVGPELPTLGGALLGALVFAGVLRTVRGAVSGDRASPIGRARLLRAGAPYLLLIVLVLATRLFAPLKAALASVSMSWTLAPFGGSMQVLYHPGTMLLASLLLTALLTRISPSMLASVMGAIALRLLPVCASLIAMLGLSRVMVHAGMIDALAVAAAAGAGAMRPLFAPAIGVLGTFVTCSATTSNILLTEFQAATARQLGLSVLGLSAAQGFGAAVGNIICPHNIRGRQCDRQSSRTRG